MQVFRMKEQGLTRSELNNKLDTKIARGELEFDAKQAPETIDYHLATLVEKGCLFEQKRARSTNYAFNAEQGEKSLAHSLQYPTLSFTLSGGRLNELLKAARGSAPPHLGERPPVGEPAGVAPAPKRLGADDIAKCIEHLRADKYAGKDLIPIHEVRRLVAEFHGDEAAGHPTFDALLKRMRGDKQVELIAISDNRNATPEQLDASIPGMNEIIFFIVVE